MGDTQGQTDFFEEAEKEITNSQTENNTQSLDTGSQSDLMQEDDVWNSNEDIDTLFEKVTTNTVQTEQNENTQTEPQQNGYQLVLTKPLKYRGKEIYVKTEDELIELAQKGMDYSLKMNKIKPYRELIDRLDGSSVSLNDVYEYIEALKGDENAKRNIATKFGSFQEDTENNNFLYEEDPVENIENNSNTQQQENNKNNFIDGIIKQLHSQNPELYGKVIKVYNEIDNQFKYEITQSKDVFESFIGSVAQGEFDEVYPYAVKEKSLNPHMTWIQAYIKGNEIRLNGGYQEPQKPSEPIQQDVKNVKKQPKTIKEKYDEIWDNKHSIEELEQMLVQEI